MGDICPRAQHFGGAKLRWECFAIITRFQMSADVINYDLQNVECQRLLPVMQEDRLNALALLYINKDFKLDYS